MKNVKILCIALAVILIATGSGLLIYDKATTIDFGEIIIENIPQKNEESTRIMSFNLRYTDDEEGSIKNRSKIALAIIEQYAPDSFGVQEATGEWMKILNKNLEEKYACVSQTRSKSKDSETAAVFYLKDKFELIDSGTIWLSDTPDVPYSVYELSDNKRIATWATLKNKETDKIYTHINTHLDTVDEVNLLQANVLLNKINELSENGYPVVCTGDFNADRNTAVYEKLLECAADVRVIAENTEDGITFHEYGIKEENDIQFAIDYVFIVPKGIEAENYKIIRDTAKGMYPSDHYPIIADINFK